MSERRPVIPQDMKAFNRAIVQEWRANAGRLSGPMAGRNLILLTTTGARSGQPRTIVVGFGRNGDNLVAIASNNGAPAHPAWYLNLLADPVATVELGVGTSDALQRRIQVERLLEPVQGFIGAADARIEAPEVVRSRRH